MDPEPQRDLKFRQPCTPIEIGTGLLATSKEANVPFSPPCLHRQACLAEVVSAAVSRASCHETLSSEPQTPTLTPPQEQDMLPTLKALQKLSEDKVEVNEETGEATITEPKKIRGIGFVDFPARSIISAIQVRRWG